MSILLIGANGQVGWEVASQAGGQGIPLTGLAREQLDITNRAAVAEAVDNLRPSIIINAAAYTAVDKAEREPEQAFAVNRDAACHLVAACNKHNIPLVHISTDYVFDGNKASPYDEGDQANPLNVYGQSKLAGEQVIRDALARHLIIRTSWVFGSHGQNFVKTVLRLAKKGGPLRIVDDQSGAPTSASSIARCILDLAKNYNEHGDLPWGTYHFSCSRLATWFGFAREIVALASAIGLIEPVDIHPIATAEFPTPAKRPMDTRLATTRSLQILGCPARDWRLDLGLVIKSL
ncbi:MAG: dTDP-4-dehydrorhamnose reductase [Cellvibrionaceae bacterium]